ncbi:hypothetical protein BDEG_28386 [Batrachochytrium dendrobatidis JEL423]|uniref:P-loop containing nucleoside triphosphate hydrolase protein n=1 Tax=Batrachochytrium dendrobatidis (strain JEL423) TaxID=403673 RepID=A0A177WYN6_BATDL|nr:hypothetical protein BDEG_28386 [Batrachochytrium dendrobatidis JEL423]
MGFFNQSKAASPPEVPKPIPKLPQIKRNIFSFITLSWVTPILRLGRITPLQEKDLPELSNNDKTAATARHLAPFWKKLRSHYADPKNVPLPSFGKSMVAAFFLPFLLILFLTAVLVFLNIARPLMIPQILRVLQLQNDPSASTDGLIHTNRYVVTMTLFSMQLVYVLVIFLIRSLQINLSIKMNSTLVDAIYSKSLYISTKSRQEFSEGKINTLATADAEAIVGFPIGLNNLLADAVQIGLALYYISRVFGYATWVAVGVYLGLTLGQLVAAPFLANQFKNYMAAMDDRTKIIREFLYGIKIIKFQAIESIFLKTINASRLNQLSGLSKLTTMLVWLFSAIIIQQNLVPTASIMVYATLGYPITAENIFGGLALFDALLGPSGSIVSQFASVLQFGVSFKRVRSFIIAEETRPNEETVILPSNQTPNGSALEFVNATFTWESVKADDKKVGTESTKKVKFSPALSESQKAAPFSLERITLRIPHGACVAVVGSVGSGKSSFLSALVGGMRKTSGSSTMYGSVAYCAQEPWIQSGTIEDNILFGNDSARLNLQKAVSASCLEHDLELMPNGLGTRIGEKGINLSGGQKSRVALARAISHDADIYLLDDPIAALDAHVGKDVFDNAIRGTLRKKTVILATHQLHLLPKVDMIVLLKNGRILESGTFRELMSKSNSGLSDLMKNYHVDDAEKSNLAVNTADPNASTIGRTAKYQNENAVDEDRRVGRVSKATLSSYFASCGKTIVAFCCMMVAVGLLLTTFSRIYLALWTNDKLHLSQKDYRNYYAIIGALDAITFCLVSGFIFFATYRASVIFHNLALNGLMKAPMSFFDSQPVGRILNRMTVDVRSLDMNMAMPFINISGNLVTFVSSIIIVAYSSSYLLLQFSVFSYYAYSMFQYFTTSYRELKRLSSIMKSPLLSHISESLTGVDSIKAFGMQKQFIEQARLKVDMSNSSTMIMSSAQFWLGFRLDMLTVLVIFVLLILAATNVSHPSSLGVALISGLSIGESLNALMQLISQIEASFNSVERLNYYAHELPKEAARSLPNDPKNGTWPSHGAVSINSLKVSYPNRPDYLVIKDLSINIIPGEKVGVVGRTGSGKSTLMSILCRIMEPNQGIIEIDGINIATLGLDTLRSNIQIIPQEPILFRGTIRSNLSMQSKYSDSEIWKALEMVGLKEYVSALGEKLEDPILENGNNMSVGQRQLMCLCKAILAKPKLLIMDEATASVDSVADSRIQDSIETLFKDTTVLSIAHRLNTIAAFDRVLVLDEGVAVEFDAPHVLLGRKESVFSDLVSATGAVNAAIIRQVASEHYFNYDE